MVKNKEVGVKKRYDISLIIGTKLTFMDLHLRKPHIFIMSHQH